MKVKYISKLSYKARENNIRKSLEYLGNKEVPVINATIGLYIKGRFREEEIDNQIRWVVDQFLPSINDKRRAYDASFHIRKKEKCLMVIAKMILPPEYRALLFRSVASLQESNDNFEILQASFTPAVISAPHLNTMRKNCQK